MSSDPAGLVADLVAAVNSHDLDALVGCFAEGYVNETPVHPLRGFEGLGQVRANWSMIFRAVPDITATLRASAVDGDTVWTEWALVGTRVDGSDHCMLGVMIFEVAGRQARSVRFYLEPLDEGPKDSTAAVKMHLGQDGPSR